MSNVTTDQLAPATNDAPIPATDSAPALAGIVESQTEEPSVDLSGMPALKPEAGMRPSERARMKAALLDLMATLPEEMKSGEKDIDGTAVVENLDGDTYVKMITSAEDFLIDRAVDREAMLDWMVHHPEGESAVMAGMVRELGTLGK